MDYPGLRDEAQTQLQAEGGPLVLKRRPQQNYSPSTGNVGTATPLLDLTFYGVQMSLDESYIDGKNREWSDHFHSGSEVALAKLKLFVSAGYVDNGTVKYDVIPAKGDFLNTLSQDFTILEVSPLCPAGLTIAYEITLG